jgi:uncharacterized protein involved in exopolysaccharide biosynthesis
MTKDTDVDQGVGDYLRAFKRRAGLFFGTVAIVILVGVAIAFRVPPVYTSTGVLLSEQPDVPDRVVRSTVATYPEERVRIITQRVLTKENLDKIVAENHLFPDLDGMPVEQRSAFRSHLDLSAEDPQILENLMGSQRAAGAFAFSVAYSDASPTIARDVANDLISLYLEENQEARREQALETMEFLKQEAKRLEGEIAEREKKLAEFKTENAGSLPELQNANMQLLDRTQRDVDAVEQEIRTLRERQALYSSELAQLSPLATVMNDQGNAILSPLDRMKMLQRQYMQLTSVYSPTHPDVLKVRRELEALSATTGMPAFDRATLQSELAARQDELSAARDKYSNDHPDVQRLEKTVDALQTALKQTPATPARAPQVTPDNPAYIQREVQLKAVNIDLQAAMTRRDQLRARLTDLEGRLTTSPDVERDYQSLSRGYEQLIAQYNDTEAKLNQAEMALNLEQDNRAERFTVLEQPSIASAPSKPNRLAVLLLTFVLAIGFGAGAVAITERSDITIRRPNDVTAFLEIPPLVAIPYIENQADGRRRWRRRVVAAMAVAAWAGSLVLLIALPT